MEAMEDAKEEVLVPKTAAVSIPDTHTAFLGRISSTSEYNPDFSRPLTILPKIPPNIVPPPASIVPPLTNVVSVSEYLKLAESAKRPLATAHASFQLVHSSTPTGQENPTSSVGQPTNPPAITTSDQNSTPPTSGPNIEPPLSMSLTRGSSQDPSKPPLSMLLTRGPSQDSSKPPSSMPLTRGASQDPSKPLNKRGTRVDTPFTPMSIGVRDKDCPQLACLGLGKALDATNPHPWASKSSYQAKEVLYHGDLVLTDEGQRLVNYVKVIDNYFNVLGSLEGAIRLPHQPIEIGVAADTHRSYCLTQEIRGKTVYTRTVAFNITADVYFKFFPEDNDTLFQRHLKQHLDRAYGGTEGVERNAATDESLCLDFLRTLGGVTHYISSITLGAMEYSVKKVQALDIGSTVNSRVGFGPMAGALAAKAIVRKTKRKQVQHNEKIGRIQDEKVLTHSHDEAVISYSITSLANLVTNPQLRESVQKAIQTYITTRLHKINGPYYIITPEKVRGDKTIFWRVEKERERGGVVTHYIRLTTDRQKASKFFIRPDYRKMGKYFFITTYDTPQHTSDSTHNQEEQQPQQEQAAGLQDSVHTSTEDTDGGVLATPFSPPEDVAEFPPTVMQRGGNYGNRYLGDSMVHHHGNSKFWSMERYIHVSRKTIFKHLPTSSRIKMKSKAAVSPQFARFQLVDRRDRREKTLLESDWLPDEHESSGEPFFLRPYYHVTNCLGVSGIGQTCGAQLAGGGGGGGGGGRREGSHFTLSGMSCHREGNCHMLFQLVRPEREREASD